MTKIQIRCASLCSAAKSVSRFPSPIAPRAALGLARGQLLAGGKEDIFAARRAYEQFLEQYPNNSLTFTAICEYALSYLISYRGENYDLGALVLANAIIDQAEIETRGDAAKVAIVQAYRKRIRGWLQDLATGVRTAALTPAIAATAAQLPAAFPKDPFDRLIYATAIENGLPLVTADRALRAQDPEGRLVVW